MVVDVEQRPRLDLTSQTIEVEVAYDPNATVGQQFTFSTTEPVLLITETTTLSFVLSGAEWAENPIQFALVNSVETPTPSRTDNTVTFTIAPPSHFFIPWVFNLNVNLGTIKNISSPVFYLVNAEEAQLENPGIDFDLVYVASTGEFAVRRTETSSSNVGITLISKLILFNVLPCKLTFHLTGASFNADPAVVWSVGSQPTWITNLESDDESLSFNISSAANGQAAGFQFAIVTQDVLVISPDPILINATIGDG
jgi:hypothetical protein